MRPAQPLPFVSLISSSTSTRTSGCAYGSVDEHVLTRFRPADRDRLLRARGAERSGLAGVHAPHHGHPPARRRRGGDRRGPHLQRRRPGGLPGGGPDPPPLRLASHRRLVLGACRATIALACRPGARAVPALSPLGLRERGTRPGATAGGGGARGGAPARAPAPPP